MPAVKRWKPAAKRVTEGFLRISRPGEMFSFTQSRQKKYHPSLKLFFFLFSSHLDELLQAVLEDCHTWCSSLEETFGCTNFILSEKKKKKSKENIFQL